MSYKTPVMSANWTNKVMILLASMTLSATPLTPQQLYLKKRIVRRFHQVRRLQKQKRS